MTLPARLVVATNNAHKAEEIKALLGGRFDEVLTLKEMNINVDPKEDGATFFDNALLKARAAAEFTDLPVLADDSGLCVDFLDGRPGVYSARYAGAGASYGQNNDKLLAELADAPDGARSAHFECCVVLLFNDGSYLSADGRSDGTITHRAFGENGFGYDPYFYSEELKKTFAEAEGQEKNAVSHRARALAALSEKLTDFISRG
ncbi:MAG: RdgB/HAM1 family non-canonical purine NTP pyrophosphatase [Clostridiales bacterium]|jgi:XTP/dITP diphosphohydrolase|nr:RdgB/HAM1 family non-canonical purine NTP pyrophosphatase [Clostridiales bacterium]